MLFRKNRFVILFSFLFSVLVKSQSVSVGGLFPVIDHSGSIANKLDYSLYYFAAFPLANLKRPEVTKDAYFNLLYFEQALTYKLTNRFSLTGSYVYQRTNVVYDNYVNENRFYVQGKYKHSIKKINLTHRLRFDGRFIQNRITNETPFTNRVRYLIGCDFPINENFYFTAYEEVFFNTFKNASVVYGENWSYAAIGKKINNQNKVEAGILYITWNTGVNNWFYQYYFQVTWINHLNFRNNKS